MKFIFLFFICLFNINSFAQQIVATDKVRPEDLSIKLKSDTDVSVNVESITAIEMASFALKVIRNEYPDVDSRMRKRIEESLLLAGFKLSNKNSAQYIINVEIKDFIRKSFSPTTVVVNFNVSSGGGETKVYESTKTMEFPVSGYTIKDIGEPMGYCTSFFCVGGKFYGAPMAILYKESLVDFTNKFVTDFNSGSLPQGKSDLVATEVDLNNSKKVSRIELKAMQTRRFMKSPEVLTKSIIELNKDNGNKCISVAPIQYKCEGVLKTNSVGKKICTSIDGRNSGNIVKNEKLEDGYCQDDKGTKYSFEIDSNFPENTETTLRIRISTPKIRQVSNADAYTVLFKEIADGLFIDAIELTPAEMQ